MSEKKIESSTQLKYSINNLIFFFCISEYTHLLVEVIINKDSGCNFLLIIHIKKKKKTEPTIFLKVLRDL